MDRISFDDLPRVTYEESKSICKLGEGGACCRYLVCGEKGLECAKLSTIKPTIDEKVADGVFLAIGDNCPGKTHEAN